jgi:hypothetical protein
MGNLDIKVELLDILAGKYEYNTLFFNKLN